MEVIMSSSVQDCSLMESDNGNDGLNLTKSQRKRRRRALNRKLNANIRSLEKTDPNTGVGITATVEKSSNFNEKEHTKVANGEMGSSKPTNLNAEVEVQKKMKTTIGEMSSGINVTDNTASKKRKGKKMKNDNPDLGDSLSTRESTKEGLGMTKVLGVKCNETVSGKTATLDADMVSKEKDHAEVANGKTGESETTDLSVNSKEKWTKKPELKNKRPTLGEILNAQHFQSLEAAKGETGSGTISIDDSASKKQKRQNLNRNLNLGDIFSTCESTPEGLSTTKVLEGKSGETVLAKTAAPDANTVSKGDHTEVANGKTGESETTNLIVNDVKEKKKRKRKAKSKNKRPTLGEILNPQYLQNIEVAGGEMDPSTTSTGNPASQLRKREKMMINNPGLGDIVSTCESIQNGLSTTKVLEVKSGETVLAKLEILDTNIVSNGDHTEVSNGKKVDSETTNLNVNGKKKKKRKQKSKKKPTLGEILDPQYLQNLEAAETDSGTTSTDNTASKKQKKQKLNMSSDLGDILSTHENTQVGLSTNKILDVKSDETISGIPATSDANIVSKGDHTEVANGKMQDNEPYNLNVNGKEKKKKRKKQKSNNKGPNLGESLKPQYLEAAKHEMGSESTVLKSIAFPQVANSQITQVATLGKKLLILDVNGLLADVVTGRPKDIVADKYITRRAIFKRPYLDDFLCFCFERFNVGIWSSRTMKNLVPVINFLLGDLKKNLLFMWDVCKCTDSGIGTLEEKYKHVVVKDLRKIWDEDGPKKSWVKGTFHESNTLLVDDSPYKALLNPKHTGIFPASYSYKNSDDNFLGPKGELQTYLEGLAAADDVKTYVEQHPFGQGAIDEQSPDWAFYSGIIERLNDKNVMESLGKKNQWKKRRCRKDFYHPE